MSLESLFETIRRVLAEEPDHTEEPDSGPSAASPRQYHKERPGTESPRSSEPHPSQDAPPPTEPE
jgi:hypothetical protein